MEVQAGGRDVGSWFVLTQAGGGQLPQFTPAEDGVAREEKVFPGLVSHHLPTGAVKPFCGDCAAWKMNSLCLILMQPIN